MFNIKNNIEIIDSKSYRFLCSVFRNLYICNHRIKRSPIQDCYDDFLEFSFWGSEIFLSNFTSNPERMSQKRPRGFRKILSYPSYSYRSPPYYVFLTLLGWLYRIYLLSKRISPGYLFFTTIERKYITDCRRACCKRLYNDLYRSDDKLYYNICSY